LKTVFRIGDNRRRESRMNSLVSPVAPAPLSLKPAVPRAMTRCECSGAPFERVATLMKQGASEAEACERTGCGRTCGACIPDLRAFLAARGIR
jgi:bacterioferritin-associated ferredoxin